MTVAVSLRVLTGPSAGTESAAQTGITFISQDALSGAAVAPGTNSYERWIRLAIDDASGRAISTFTAQCIPNLPTGVEIKYGVTDTAATPTASTSTIATHTLGSTRIVWDMNSYTSNGSRTRYLVLQEQVAASAPSGAISQNTLAFGWQVS